MGWRAVRSERVFTFGRRREAWGGRSWRGDVFVSFVLFF